MLGRAIRCNVPSDLASLDYEVGRRRGAMCSVGGRVATETAKCSILRRQGAVLCSIHKVGLEEIGANEVMSPGPSPHPFSATSWRCPVSGQVIPDIQIGQRSSN